MPKIKVEMKRERNLLKNSIFRYIITYDPSEFILFSQKLNIKNRNYSKRFLMIYLLMIHSVKSIKLNNTVSILFSFRFFFIYNNFLYSHVNTQKNINYSLFSSLSVFSFLGNVILSTLFLWIWVLYIYLHNYFRRQLFDLHKLIRIYWKYRFWTVV